MSKTKLKYTVVKDGKFFVAELSKNKLASQGRTEREAIKNLHEAYKLLNEK